MSAPLPPIDHMSSTDAYQLGWADRERAMIDDELDREAFAIGRRARDLDRILDRVDAVEPHPHLPEPEPPAAVPAVFDQEQLAA